MFLLPSRLWRVLVVVASVIGAGFICVAGWRTADAQSGAPAEDADTMFRRLDTDKDGKISRADIQGNNRAMIERIIDMAGKKPDAGVSREEFQRVFDKHRRGAADPATPAGGSARTTDRPNDHASTPANPAEPATNTAPSIVPALRWLDRDNNGKVTRAEFNRLNELWDRLDANKDGTLDAEEIASSDRALRESTPRHGGDRPASPETERSRSNPDRPGPIEQPRNEAKRDQRDATATRLEGVWRGWIVSPRGSNESEMELTVTANRMEGKELGQRRGNAAEGLGTGTFTMTGEGKTGHLDAEGTGGQQRGKRYLGIYELDGDTLRWCVCVHEGERPRKLASGDGNYLMVLVRQGANR